MTTTPGELVGLPDGGPTSVELVKAWLRIPDTDTRDDATLDIVVPAVNNQVRGWRCSMVAVGAADWTGAGAVVAGATMLAARLVRRRNTPSGVEAFGSDGASYVSRNDPDIGQLLGLGAHSKPTAG
jgi:hypothetical protein